MKAKQQTNYRILIQRKNGKDDGKGFANDQNEAVILFDRVISKTTAFEFAELHYEGKLIKRV